jgi:4-amino-4-deoxy-L-arabinose transferase-like glycosyltransferase
MSGPAARAAPWLLGIALLASWAVGLFGRGYWTPDEPREADIAWRMSWQADKAVPLLAGEAFCEKPPLTYWLAAASMRSFGDAAWAARLPNLLYAVLTTLSVAWLAWRLAGSVAAAAAAAASATLLLSYQVAIWLATDAPLLAASALALAGLHAGFYATTRRGRLAGYTVLHVALAAGFLAKSAAAWVVPVLVFGTLILWERRWRELLRWELWAGLALQALIIGSWIGAVYAGPDGVDHLKVFFWNNLVGRFTHVDAPADLQYTQAHQNSPGKYLLEMPLYLFPWTLLVVAAVLRAWRCRHELRQPDNRAVRWALAGTLPALALLSIAATARNIYFAPSLPAVALLLGWWAREAAIAPQRADRIALRATAALVGVAGLLAAAAVFAALDAAGPAPAAVGVVGVTVLGTGATLGLSLRAFRAGGRGRTGAALLSLLLAYACLLTGPASQAYRLADRWQDLGSLGSALHADLQGAPLLLVAPDETTRAWVDQYVTTAAGRVAVPQRPADAAALAATLQAGPRPRYALVQLEGRALQPRLIALARQLGIRHLPAPSAALPPWAAGAGLEVVRRYELPNGRRYALLAAAR